jgi:inhibitor of the pro-sigma K processing machinery
MVFGIGNALVSELVIVAASILILYIIFRLGKLLMGLIVNVVLGFVSIFVINAVFGLGISFSLLAIIITALLGLPGVALIIILKVLGVSI